MQTKPKFNAKNQKVKEIFFELQEHAKRRDPKTVRFYADAVHEFEVFTNFQDFKKFNTTQAIDFKEYLLSKKNKRTGRNISKSYLRCSTYAKNFFMWLCMQKSYKNINPNDVEYFSLTRNDTRRALATGYQESYEIKDILSTIRKMPSNTEIEMRNKAMISLCLLYNT